MALFFDQEWFDERLKVTGRTRDDVAATLGLSRQDVDEIWKDQREVTPNQVAMLARLLEAPATEIVNRAGVATPTPTPTPTPMPSPASAGDAELEKNSRISTAAWRASNAQLPICSRSSLQRGAADAQSLRSSLGRRSASTRMSGNMSASI